MLAGAAAAAGLVDVAAFYSVDHLQNGAAVELALAGCGGGVDDEIVGAAAWCYEAEMVASAAVEDPLFRLSAVVDANKNVLILVTIHEQ